MSKKNKKKHAPHEEEGGEAWLLPYSDLMTLLLAVFIVLFAVSKVDAAKAAQMSSEFREAMMTSSFVASELSNQGKAQNESSKNSKSESDTKISEEVLESFMGKYELQNLEQLKDELDAKFQKDDMSSVVTTSIDMRGLVISLNNAVFFQSGSAEIRKDNEDALIEVAGMVNSLNNYIRIEGHTDNVPMHSTLYPSNWELSTARAVSVVRLFVDKCNIEPEKLVAVGYGEYKPVADNSTAEGRTKNRRIDIIVLSGQYNDLEKQITK
ncbi:MAG: chemotaxis protein MotB [Clostridiales bacterium]|uniref:flagellar motor protein MotB n=1 Tax=Aminipila sp. TaxID=2060095 RepID=UPI001DE97767|nr:flagellar motor protein MotB [Aminipila sp.]MBE6033976.1 chemotaxis protein MotB [Clostridiales bacterium]